MSIHISTHTEGGYGGVSEGRCKASGFPKQGKQYTAVNHLLP